MILESIMIPATGELIQICTAGVRDIRPHQLKRISFISELNRRLTNITGESREASFLYQRLSIAIQRFNCISFRGCLPQDTFGDK